MASIPVTSKTDHSRSDVTTQSGIARKVVRKAIQSPRVMCFSPRKSARMPMSRQKAALNPVAQLPAPALSDSCAKKGNGHDSSPHQPREGMRFGVGNKNRTDVRNVTHN